MIFFIKNKVFYINLNNILTFYFKLINNNLNLYYKFKFI